MPTAECKTCKQDFVYRLKQGRRPFFCSQDCRSRQNRIGLPDWSTCPSCQKVFRPGRQRGKPQQYCSRLCNPKYGWPCTVCGVIKDAGAGSRTPDQAEQYVCQPCRRIKSQAQAAERLKARPVFGNSYGGLRPIDPAAGAWYQGPLVRQSFEIWRYPSGERTISCPGCTRHLHLESDQEQMMCGSCLIMVWLEADVAA